MSGTKEQFIELRRAALALIQAMGAVGFERHSPPMEVVINIGEYADHELGKLEIQPT